MSENTWNFKIKAEIVKVDETKNYKLQSFNYHNLKIAAAVPVTCVITQLQHSMLCFNTCTLSVH